MLINNIIYLFLPSYWNIPTVYKPQSSPLSFFLTCFSRKVVPRSREGRAFMASQAYSLSSELRGHEDDVGHCFFFPLIWLFLFLETLILSKIVVFLQPRFVASVFAAVRGLPPRLGIGRWGFGRRIPRRSSGTRCRRLLWGTRVSSVRWRGFLQENAFLRVGSCPGGWTLLCCFGIWGQWRRWRQCGGTRCRSQALLLMRLGILFRPLLIGTP